MELSPLAPEAAEAHRTFRRHPAARQLGEARLDTGPPRSPVRPRGPLPAAADLPPPWPPSLLAGLVALGDALAMGLATLSLRAAATLFGWPAETPAGLLLVAAGLTLIFGASGGAYDRRTLLAASGQLPAILPAAAAGWALAALSFVAAERWDQLAPYWSLCASALGGLGALALERAAIAAVLGGPAGRRFAPRALIVGGGTRVLPLADELGSARAGRPRLVGAASDDDGAADLLRHAGLPFFGSTADALRVLLGGHVEQVVLPADWALTPGAAAILRRLADFPVEVYLAAELSEFHRDRRVRLLCLQERPIAGWPAGVKSAMDCAVALAALAVAAVPMLLIALAIRAEGPGPVIFRQRRTGFDGREFLILKFRTMHHHTADIDVLQQVKAGDERVTRVGALLRRTSTDELPQLLNVLAGEMSLIGPRPHAPETRAGGRRFDEISTHYAARHRVKPGLTGLAQVRGWRGSTETEEQLLQRLDSDLEYIDNWSLLLDFSILIRTLAAVASGRNAH